MIDEASITALAATRDGFELIACPPVALPGWRLQLRVELLARRDISPLEAFVLRAAVDADSNLGMIQRLLGLDDHTFEDTVASICGREWARVTSAAALDLTERGRNVRETGKRERSEDRPVWVDFDGLLRQPIFLDAPLEPQQARDLGLLSIPAWPPGPPDVLELGRQARPLERLIRQAGDGRDQEIDLLAIKGVLRRERVYREALLCVFRSEHGDIQAVPVIDGQPSPGHELALAEPQLRRILRIATELRRGRRYDQLLPPSTRELFNPDADDRAATLRLQSRSPSLATEVNGTGTEELRQRAAEATRALSVRRIGPQENSRLLRIAVQTARKRLLIAVPTLSPMSLDADLLRELRRAMARDVDLVIAHSTPADPPMPGFVRSLFDRDGAQEVEPREPVRVCTLVRDNTLAMCTLYPLLHDAGRERPLRDERGWLVTDRDQVALIANEMIARVLTN